MRIPSRYTGPVALALLLGGCSSSDPYQGLTAEELFTMASQEYAQEDYEHAVRAVERLLVSHGDWPRIPEARLLLAHARYADKDYLLARSEYNRFLDRYPSHRSAPDAALGVCRSLAALSPEPERDQGFTEDALATCRNVVLDYRGTPAATEAADIANTMRLKLAEKEYLTADFYFRRKMYDSAIRYYEFVANLYSETAFAPRALLGLYRANMEIGYEDLAEEARQRLLDQYPDSEAAAEVRTNGAGA